MHEGSIVSSLFEIAEQSKKDANLKEITKVKIVVGKFHQIVEEVMLMHFDIMKQDIPGFENAVLEMEEKDVKIKCSGCGKIFTIDEPIFICPDCDSIETELFQGKELHIQTMEGIE
ncbi:MAG: hydrogenase maturation nickel metallochaperone HypA [Candidatus Cloacimonadales bacterium]|nr:hydrogenase maturation nickel metallochaperone HypA [Candidatus Cloacimonadales bacterium]